MLKTPAVKHFNNYHSALGESPILQKDNDKARECKSELSKIFMNEHKHITKLYKEELELKKEKRDKKKKKMQRKQLN